MGLTHFMLFFFLGIFHFSFAKECPGCSKITDVNDPIAIQYLGNKIKDVTPKGTNDEQTELVRIKEIKKQVVKGVIYMYDFEARGLKSNSPYECKLVLVQQEWLGVKEVKEYDCKVISSEEEERSISEEEDFLTEIENNLTPTSFKFNKKKYAQCMKRAAIKCLL
nr:uncharacterized protein LOC106688369 [Halyomorpha halys]